MTAADSAGADFWIDTYRRMATIRAFEERVDELYRAAIMPGLAHVSIGQEATEWGSCDNLLGKAQEHRLGAYVDRLDFLGHVDFTPFLHHLSYHACQ